MHPSPSTPAPQDLFGLPPPTEADLKKTLQTLQAFVRQTLHRATDWTAAATARLSTSVSAAPAAAWEEEEVDMTLAKDVQFWVKAEAMLSVETGALLTDANFAKWLASCLPLA